MSMAQLKEMWARPGLDKTQQLTYECVGRIEAVKGREGRILDFVIDYRVFSLMCNLRNMALNLSSQCPTSHPSSVM